MNAARKGSESSRHKGGEIDKTNSSLLALPLFSHYVVIPCAIFSENDSI